MRRMLSVISARSKTCFQSSRISRGLPKVMALLQASENCAGDLLEDHRRQDGHVAQQEVARAFGRHAARHHLVHRLAHHVQQRGAHGLGQARLQQRHLLHRQPVAAQDGLVDGLGDRLAQVEGARRGPASAR
jgi:hypothetical protein